MPGNSGASSLLTPARARNLAIRFSRNSSLTERPTRAEVNSLERSAPSVAGRTGAISKYRWLPGAEGAHPGLVVRVFSMVHRSRGFAISAKEHILFPYAQV